MFVSTFASAYLVLIALRHEEEERQALEIAEQKKEETIFEHVADSANQKIDRLAAATASDFDHFAVLANQNIDRLSAATAAGLENIAPLFTPLATPWQDACVQPKGEEEKRKNAATENGGGLDGRKEG